MKKTLSILLVLTMLFLFAACSGNKNNKSNNNTNSNDNGAQTVLPEGEKEYYLSEVYDSLYFEGSNDPSSDQEFFNADGKLIRKVFLSHSGDPYIDITYDELGRIKSIYDGGTATLTFNAQTIEFNYEDNTASTDVDSGNAYGITNITIKYDENNKLKSFKAKYSEKNDSEYKYDLSYEYYDNGKLSTITSGYSKSYYDPDGNLTIREFYTNEKRTQISSIFYYTYEKCRNTYFVKEQQSKVYEYESQWDTEPDSIEIDKNNCWTCAVTEETDTTVKISRTYASDNSNVTNPYNIEAYILLTFDENGNLISKKTYNSDDNLLNSITYTWSVK